MTHIMVRVLRDSINGTLVACPGETPGQYTVDLEYYRVNFAACVSLAEFAAAVLEWKRAREGLDLEPEVSAADDAVIFGGV